MAFGLGIEGQPVDDIDHIAQDVAGAKLVTQFSEDLADLVLDRTRAFGRLPEGREIGEQIAVDEGDQVVADQGFVMIEATFGRFGRSPIAPPEVGVDQRLVALASQFRPVPALGLEVVQILQEQDPGRLFHIV